MVVFGRVSVGLRGNWRQMSDSETGEVGKARESETRGVIARAFPRGPFCWNWVFFPLDLAGAWDRLMESEKGQAARGKDRGRSPWASRKSGVVAKRNVVNIACEKSGID
jgi:hypothetical protein